MIALTFLLVPLGVLILLAGYCYGRAESDEFHAAEIAELERTVEALLPKNVKVVDQ